MATSDSACGDAGLFFKKDISIAAFKRVLVFLALLGLIVRFGFFIEHACTPSFGVPTLDQKYYDTVAKMLLSGEDLRVLHGFRPLLYPMFLAANYRIGGSWGVDLALLVQHLMGIATGLIVALLGERLLRHRISGIAAGALYLLAPVPLYFEGELLIESSYIFLICFGLLVHLRAADTEKWKSSILWFTSGALLALAAQARANILVFVAVYPLFALWRWWLKRQMIELRPLGGLAGALAMMAAWGFINMKQSDRYHLVPNAGGVNFYLGNKRGADGMFTGEDVILSLSSLSLRDKSTSHATRPEQGGRSTSGQRYEDLVEVWAREEYEAAMRAQGQEPQTDPMAISKYWSKRALEEIRAAPADWFRLMAKKCWLMFWNAEVPNNKDFAFLQHEYVWLRLLPVRWVVLLILAPAGLWAAAKSGNRNALFILMAYAAIYSAGNVAFFICDRYRYPVWPVMATFAGGGISYCIEIIRQRRTRAMWGAAASMILMATLSLHNWFGAKLPNFAHDFQFRSMAWFEKGNFEEALKDINQSAELDPLDPATQHHRGNVLLALNRLDEAKEAFQLTLKRIPGDSSVWNNLGVTLDLLGDTESALEAFRRATECKTPSENAFLGMAFIQTRKGRLDDASAVLNRLDQLQPSRSAQNLAVRSVIERQRGNLHEAEKLEQQARALDPEATAWAIERTRPRSSP